MDNLNHFDITGDNKSLIDFVNLAIQIHLDQVIELPSLKREIGPSGEFYIRNILHSVFHEKFSFRESSIIVPCVRNESHVLIQRGTHLSLFFMLVSIYFGNNSYQKAVETLFKILKIKKNRHEVGSNIENIRMCGNIDRYNVGDGGFQSAREFPYYGVGVEFSTNNCEIAHFAEVYHEANDERNREISCHMFGIGIERLVLEHFGINNIWKSPYFCKSVLKEFSYLELDQLRKQFFLGKRNLINNIDFSSSLIRFAHKKTTMISDNSTT